MDFPCNICSQNICTDVKISQGCFGCSAPSPLLSFFFGLFPGWNTCASGRRRQRLERHCRKLSCDPDQDEPTAGGSVAGSYVDTERRNRPTCGFILFSLHKSGWSSAISQNQEGVLEPQERFSLFRTKIERNCSHFLQTLLATKQLTGGKTLQLFNTKPAEAWSLRPEQREPDGFFF